MKYIFLLFSLCVCLNLQAQPPVLYAMHSKWDDAFTEWEVQTNMEDEEGNLALRWPLQRDYSKWDFNIEDNHGQISLKFPTGLQQWEIRIGSEVALLQQQWKGDVSQWRITDNSITLHFKTKYPNQPFEWRLRESDRYGEFIVHTAYDGDPRDWVIIDELSEDISLPMKMGMAFIAVYQVIPKP